MRAMLLASYIMNKLLRIKAEKELRKYAQVDTAFSRIKILTVYI